MCYSFVVCWLLIVVCSLPVVAWLLLCIVSWCCCFGVCCFVCLRVVVGVWSLVVGDCCCLLLVVRCCMLVAVCCSLVFDYWPLVIYVLLVLFM